MEIQPEKQNLDRLFSTTIYYIDFYQRDYKWSPESPEQPVERLLDDVFYHFEESYLKHSSLEPNKENINARYDWYYLNTYVTNHVDGKVFVVDGQQRLTALTLFLLKLHAQARAFQSKTTKWLENKIAGYSGTEHEFWMNHVRHIHVLKALYEEESLALIDTSSGITAVNMVRNYQTISRELDARLTTQHKFDTFVHYFLFRLVLINLSVETTHVPMVFEVINDRGVRLKPYEIIKGKLLGQIDKIELDSGKFNELWEERLRAVNSNGSDEIDHFFRYWLKAKFADSRKVGQRFDGDYHREMFKSDLNEKLKLDHNAVEVKAFLNGAFRYYTNLYCRLREASREEEKALLGVFCNRLNEQNNQFLLVLSACKVDDPEETAKIQVVTTGLDRLFSLLQLQGAYDSNEYTVRLFEISAEIREKPAADILAIFEKHLIEELRERRGIPDLEAFNFSLFKGMSVDRLNKRFTRYLMGRVEMLLAERSKQQMRHPLEHLVTKSGPVNGFHVEHIIARNDDNLALFGGDQERFEQERNRLGAILLLRGNNNESSGNENYSAKLATYANSLLWNETLREDSYKSKLDFTRWVQQSGLPFKHHPQFGPVEIEERQKLLFALCNLIWPAPHQELLP